MTETLPPLAIYAALIGHRYVCGLAFGAAEADDRAGAFRMALLALGFQGALTAVGVVEEQRGLDLWLIVVCSAISAAATVAPVRRGGDESRVFAIALGFTTIYTIVGGLWATPTMGILLAMAVAPGFLAFAAGWNRGAGFWWYGESGSPVPSVAQALVWLSALSVFGALAWLVYQAII